MHTFFSGLRYPGTSSVAPIESTTQEFVIERRPNHFLFLWLLILQASVLGFPHQRLSLYIHDCNYISEESLRWLKGTDTWYWMLCKKKTHISISPSGSCGHGAKDPGSEKPLHTISLSSSSTRKWKWAPDGIALGFDIQVIILPKHLEFSFPFGISAALKLCLKKKNSALAFLKTKNEHDFGAVGTSETKFLKHNLNPQDILTFLKDFKRAKQH